MAIFLRSGAAALLALGLFACSATHNPVPSPVSGQAIENPVSCADLGGAQVVGMELHLDGGIPNCGADGLRCPLTGVSTGDVCGARNVVATCAQHRWALRCEAPSDAAAPTDAGDAATSEAGDAAPEAGDAAAD